MEKEEIKSIAYDKLLKILYDRKKELDEQLSTLETNKWIKLHMDRIPERIKGKMEDYLKSDCLIDLQKKIVCKDDKLETELKKINAEIYSLESDKYHFMKD